MRKFLEEAEKIIPTLQRYYLQGKSREFLESLQPDSKQRRFIEILTEKYTDDLEDKISKLSHFNKRELEQITTFFMEKKQGLTDLTQDKLKKIMNQLPYTMQFSYTKPVEHQKHNINEQRKKQIKCRLQINSSQIEQAKKIIESNGTINSISLFILRKLDETYLKTLSKQLKIQLFQQFLLLRHWSPDFIVEILEEITKNNSSFQFIKYQYLTLDQMKKLYNSQNIHIQNLTTKDQFLKIYVPALFAEQAKILNKVCTPNISNWEERQKILKEINQTQFKQTKIWKLFQASIFKEIVFIDLKLQNPKKEHFIKYLKNYCSQINSMNKQFRKQRIQTSKLVSQTLNWNLFESYMAQQGYTNTMMVQQYLDKLIKKEVENDTQLLKQLSYYFDKKTLKTIQIKSKLALGLKVDGAQIILGGQYYEDLQKEIILTILPGNKKRFKIDQDINLKLKLKNIKFINIKAYQLNLESLKLNNNQNIDNIDVSFLKPTYEAQCGVEQTSPFKQTIIDLPLKFIEKKAVSYIVQLQYKGICCKAIIRKGGIIMHEKKTIAGKQLNFFDEEGRKITDYKLWFEDKEELIKDSFMIPLTDTQKKYQIVVVKDLNAQKFIVNSLQETYSLKIDYFYNAESFIVGTKAKIVLSPRILFYNQVVSIKLLKNVKIDVKVKDMHGVQSIQSYENVILENDLDYVVQFPIKSYLSDINIQFNAQIQKCSKVKIPFFNSHSIKIDLLQNAHFVDIYLNKVNDEYQITLLGLNAQPIVNADINLNYQYNSINKANHISLTTNQQGKIFLGNLQNICVVATYGRVTKSWKINQQNTNILCTNMKCEDTLYYHQGDIISLPISKQHNIEHDISFYQSNEYLFFGPQNRQKMTIQNQRIIIKGLKKGQYFLDDYLQKSHYEIQVIGGKKLEGTKIIMNEDNQQLLEINGNSNKNFGFTQQKIEQIDGEIQITLGVNQTSQNKNLRYHVVMSQFLYGQFNNFTPSFTNHFGSTCELISHQFSFPKCQYFSNIQYSEEQNYVRNRKHQKSSIGNYLEKPRILLKRIEYNQTIQEAQNLNSPRTYCKQQQKLKKLNKPPQIIRHKLPTPPNLMKTNFTVHNNFLVHQAKYITNLKGKQLSIKVPKHFNCVRIIAVTQKSIFSKDIFTNKTEFKTKDITNKGFKDQDQKSGWGMSREIYKLYKGESMKISRDSQWCLVGLPNLKSLAKIKNIVLPQWVFNWNSYDLEQKLKIYDDSYCHELNTYIYENDHKFFKSVVEPFIKNKLIKTVVDLALLNDSLCLNYLEVDKFETLNDFERILIIKYLIRNGKQELAETVANRISLSSKNIKIESSKKQLYFDTIINSKESTEQLEIAKKKKEPQYQQQQCQEDMQMGGLFDGGCGGGGGGPQRGQMREIVWQQYSQDEDLFGEQQVYMEKRQKIKQGFKIPQKTKQYAQVTYDQHKIGQTTQLISPSIFWAQLAIHLIKNPGKEFLSESMLYLQSKRQYALASCFLPNESNLNYQLQAEDKNIKISAISSFLVFVKQIKTLPHEKKFGIIINQRFSDPKDKYSYQEDGLRVQKEVSEFLQKTVYEVQTIVTNTSGSQLQIQILQDIPSGSIPQKQLENTKIINQTISPYSTKSFSRSFYFPSEGKFLIYPANASRNKIIIAKATSLPEIQVKKYANINRMETLDDLMKSGDQGKVFQFLEEKNIFDNQIFNNNSISSIGWMLLNRQFYDKVLTILRRRMYWNRQIWNFGYHHKDIKTIIQSLKMTQRSFRDPTEQIFFQYYPYESSRTHQFQDENMSTIRNNNLKDTYNKFLIAGSFQQKLSSTFKIGFIYYLMLQDRLQQASKVYSQLSQQQKESYRIQVDYLQCFMDIKEGYPNFTKARKISQLYLDYPVISWRKLFQQVNRTLKQYDTQDFKKEEVKTVYSTTYVQESNQLKINIPPEIKVKVSLFAIDLQLYFSLNPTSQVKLNGSIMPFKQYIYQYGQSRTEIIERPTDLLDVYITIEEIKPLCKNRIISSFTWINSLISVKISSQIGSAKIYYDKKKLAGCYCKVFSVKGGSTTFYKDGYTDMTGTFRYVQADLYGINRFIILFMTPYGGKILSAIPPNQSLRY